MAKNNKTKKKLHILLSTSLAASALVNPSVYAAPWTVNDETSLNAALSGAVVGDTIVLDSNTTIDLTNNPANIANKVTIEGNDSIINVAGKKGFSANGLASIEGVTIKNASSTAVTVNSLDSIFNSYFDNNSILATNAVMPAPNGGALNITNVFNGTILDSSFTNNTARSTHAGTIARGGAVYFNSGLLNANIDNVLFEGNRAVGNDPNSSYGGAIYLGGTVRALDSSAIENSRFINNSAGHGGAIHINNSIFNSRIENNLFTGNTAESRGGAINLIGNSMQNSFIDSNRFISNSAVNGGAIYTSQSLTGSSISNNLFQGNSASSSGGGIVFTNTVNNSDINNNTFELNSAINGGALYFNNNVTAQTRFNDNMFTQNVATNDGGAIYAKGNFSAILNNSTFENNSAGNLGGAIFVDKNFDVTVATGTQTVFNNNTDSTGTNSIYFNNALSTGSIQLNVNGELLLYDPITGNTSRPTDLTKNGTGLLTLGGNSNLGANNWNINTGTFKLTYDSQNNNAQINGALNFNLGANATLQVVPDTSLGNANPAQINSTNIQLDGKTTVGSDYRFIAQQAFTGEQVLLTLSTAYTGNGDLINTDGQFSLGQYNYDYENLHWDGDNLVFNVKSRNINAERNGAYTANADFRTRLANKTPYLIFEHFQKPFAYIKANQEQQHLTATEKPSENLWGSAFYSKTNYQALDSEVGAKSDISGFILGQDFNVTDKSFNGAAVSIAWPKYEQGTLEADGKDIRLNFYGGTLLKSNWEFGYLATVGFGDMAHERTVGNAKNNADKDIKTYSVGFNLAKDFYQNQNTTLRPFVSYEYIKTHSDGYTESDPNVGISALGHREDTSRIRLGLNYIKQTKNNSSFVGTVFYQGLFGDNSSNINSYMTSDPNSMINLSGSNVDRHSIGLGLGWNRRFNEKLNLNLSYNALFSANANDHQIKAELNFNF